VSGDMACFNFLILAEAPGRVHPGSGKLADNFDLVSH
jgi:hypothetical protein